MTVRQLIPGDLAQLAPGPELGVLLGGLDISALTGTDLVEVLRARARQLSHEQAQLLAAMVQVGLCDPHAEPDEVARLAQAPEYAADEIRAALAWTRNAAYREHHFAETLLARLPAVFTALDTGVICRSKAWLFTELCAELTGEQAQVVCARLLPLAGRLTTGELAARIKKLAIALDPQWAARRYASAVQDRDVIGYLDEDGTATVTGRKLPADQAAAACARIEDLAKAAKRAGHPGRIGPLRADIYVGLLEGRWQHLTRDQIITDLLAQAVPGDIPQDPTPDSTSDGSPAAPDGGDGAEQPARGERVGVEVRVGLSTLLGRDRHPGEIPGWGPVTAETARTIVAAQRTGEWRYAITDAEGQLILDGITRRRPAMPVDEAAAPKRGGIVELHIPAVLLTELAAHPDACGEWSVVIADLADQYATDRTQDTRGARVAPGQDPAARFAGAVLRRHVQIRDRVCVHPAAAARPATPTSTIPSTTLTAGLPPRPIPARCAGTTTGSNTRVGGGYTSPNQETLSGSARWVAMSFWPTTTANDTWAAAYCLVCGLPLAVSGSGIGYGVEMADAPHARITRSLRNVNPTATCEEQLANIRQICPPEREALGVVGYDNLPVADE